MIYLIIIVLLVFFSFIYDFSNLKGGEKLFYNLMWFIFVLLFGLRYRVGGDTINYMIVYDSMPTISELIKHGFRIGKLQPLWQILCAFAKSIHPDFVVLQIIHAIIVNTIIFKFIKANTKYYFTGILLYFLYYSFYFNVEILRESLAISFFLLSLNSFLRKKWFIYYIWVTISFLFHYSAIILFVIPLFHSLKLNRKTFILLISYFVFGLIISKYFVMILDSFHSGDGIIDSIRTYLDYKFTIFGVISVLLLYIVLPSSVYYLSKKIFKIESKYYVFLGFYVVVGCSISYFSIFFRFVNYFTPILCLFFTEILHLLFRQKGILRLRLLVTMILFIMISTIFMKRYFTDTSEFANGTRWYSRWYPYVSVFNKKLDIDRERLQKGENIKDL